MTKVSDSVILAALDIYDSAADVVAATGAPLCRVIYLQRLYGPANCQLDRLNEEIEQLQVARENAAKAKAKLFDGPGSVQRKLESPQGDYWRRFESVDQPSKTACRLQRLPGVHDRGDPAPAWGEGCVVSLITDLMAWYRCTEDAAEHIARCAAEKAAETGAPLQNDLRSIAEAAGLPFFIGRALRASLMTLDEVKYIQRKAAEIRARIDVEGGNTA